MSDFRAFGQPASATAAEIRLSPEESHHLVTVNRCRVGDPVVVFDGRGREWLTECSIAAKTATVLRIRETRPALMRAATITLAQALPKGATMDEIVRQATEVGVARIVPILSERTQVQLDGERAEKKVEKWRVTAIEAAKQCGNPWLPEIAPVQSLAEFLRAEDPGRLRLIASLQPQATSLRRALEQFRAQRSDPASNAVWLIGPEGDFSPSEYDAAREAGYLPVTLGKLVLRSDTAALYALSILSNELATG